MYDVIFYGIFIAQQAGASSSTPAWLIILLAILSSGALATGLTLWFNRKKTSSETEKIDADAADIIQRAAGELIVKMENQWKIDREQAEKDREHARQEAAELRRQVQELIAQNETMKTQVAKIPELEKLIEELKVAVDTLTGQLIDHGITPAYPPQPPRF